MSLQSIASFIGSTIDPLANWLTDKSNDRFGKRKSAGRQKAIRTLAAVLLLIPLLLLAGMMVGSVIFSFQMLYAGF